MDRGLVISADIMGGDGRYRHAQEGETPALWGVYGLGPDGSGYWQADFYNDADARLFVEVAQTEAQARELAEGWQVYSCISEGGHVRRPEGEEVPEFWGLYEVVDGYPLWRADFAHKDDAVLFARQKAKMAQIAELKKQVRTVGSV